MIYFFPLFKFSDFFTKYLLSWIALIFNQEARAVVYVSNILFFAVDIELLHIFVLVSLIIKKYGTL